MLHELLRLFRPGNPLSMMAEELAEMLRITCDMTVTAGKLFFGDEDAPEDSTSVYEQDVRVNKLERSVRKQVVAHLSVSGNTPNLPYCLALLNLVKDVERIGDYAKNLSELLEIRRGPLPDDDIVGELREIRAAVERAFRATGEILADSDAERALELIRLGKDHAQRANKLVSRIARSDYDPATTAAVVLAVRYYKRFGGHLLNVLSSVVMPLHKIDYYDENEIVGPG